MQTLDASIEIDAPAERVWRVLAELDDYPKWNPFITRATGEFKRGARLDITIEAPGIRAARFRPRVLDVDEGRLVRWKGQWFLPGLFDGRHALIVEPLDEGRARFTTHEEVSGILLPFLGKAMRASQEGFEQLCRAVKRRAEELEREADPPRGPG